MDTFIINNEIYNSSREGIFIYDATNPYISRNRIFDNFDGIVVGYSSVTLIKNLIYKNKSCGVVIVK